MWSVKFSDKAYNLPLAQFRSFVKEQQLFTSGDKILAAVSGGRDSVVMALLLHAAGVKFSIAHCNFHLRDEESLADENFCRELAETLQVPFHKADFDTSAYAAALKISIQMAARELRYRWFEEIREEHQYDYIALAHHQNDSVETVLLNLVRGTGIAGMHGILPKRENIVRPLLFLTRNEIDEIVESNAIAYREDHSNFSSKYARNKLRLEVIPQLKELNPSLEETFEKNIARFASLETLLYSTVEKLRVELFASSDGCRYKINLEKLKQIKPLELLLYELFRPFNFNESVLKDLINTWNGQAGKVFFSSSHQLLLDRNELLLFPIDRSAKEIVKIRQGQKEVRWENSTLNSRVIPAVEFNPEVNPSTAYFDTDLLQYPLQIRSWIEGDWFFPFGMKGKKKLSDFFISEKISRAEKAEIPILVNGNGDVLWVCGYRSDDRYKVTSRTRKVTIFEVQN